MNLPIESILVKFDRERCEDTFGDEMFDDVIINIVEEKYDETLSKVLEGYNTKNIKLIKSTCHTIKTNSKYLFEMGFADINQKMENWSGKEENWEKLNEHRTYYFAYLDIFYVEALKCYIEIKKKLNQIVSNEYLEKVKDPRIELKAIEATNDSTILTENDEIEEDIKININKENIIKLHSKEYFEDLIVKFVEVKFDEILVNLGDGYGMNDIKQIKIAALKAKEISSGLNVLGFTDQCKKMDEWCSNESNWNKINNNKEYFMNYFNAFYLDCLNFYLSIKKDLEEKIVSEYKEKIKPFQRKIEMKKSNKVSILSCINAKSIINEEDENGSEVNTARSKFII